MPPRKIKPRKIATQTSLMLGLVAGITLNLLTSWFQRDILSNPILFILMIVAIVAVGYYVIKKLRSGLLTTIFVILVFTIFINLFTDWLQHKILRDSFTTLSVTVFLLITITILALSILIGLHPISLSKRKLTRLYRENARNTVHFASMGSTRNMRKTRKSKKR